MLRKKVGISVATAITAVALSMSAVAPAQANTFAVALDKSTNLVAAGDSITVTLTNVPAEAGVYVRLCQGTPADALIARPANCFGAGEWVSTSASAKRMGAKDATLPIALAVKSTFVVGAAGAPGAPGAPSAPATSGGTTIDCSVQACSVHIRRDHFAGGDRSLDQAFAVSFAAAPKVSAKVAAQAGKVVFTALNLKGQRLTFVVGGKKIVRTATSDSFVFTAKAPYAKGKSTRAAVIAAGKSVVSKSIVLK